MDPRVKERSINLERRNDIDGHNPYWVVDLAHCLSAIFVPPLPIFASFLEAPNINPADKGVYGEEIDSQMSLAHGRGGPGGQVAAMNSVRARMKRTVGYSYAGM